MSGLQFLHVLSQNRIRFLINFTFIVIFLVSLCLFACLLQLHMVCKCLIVRLHIFLVGFALSEDIAYPGRRRKCGFFNVFLYEFIKFLLVLSVPHEVIVLDRKGLHLIEFLFAIGRDILEIGLIELLQHA